MNRTFARLFLCTALSAALPTLSPSAAADTSAPAEVDIRPLDSIVRNAPTVVFGEDSHGMDAVHELVPRVFEHLVESKGFRVFVFEAQWGLTEEFEDFMRSDRNELSTMDKYYLNGAFASAHTGRMMVWIRDWNRAHPQDPILIAGYQPEQPVKDVRALDAFLQKALPEQAQSLRLGLDPCRAGDSAYATDLDFMTATGKRVAAGQPTYTAAERKACLDGLARIEERLATLEPDRARGVQSSQIVLAKLHALSLRTYVDVIRRTVDFYIEHPKASAQELIQGQKDIYGKVDEVRFRIYEQLRALRFPEKKVFLWMHNWHAAKHASETGVIPPSDFEDDGRRGAGAENGIPKGTVSLGERIAGASGSSAVFIGNLVPCGQTCKEPRSSLEPAFTQRFGDRPAWIDLRKVAATRGLPVDAPGSLYANHHRMGFGDVALARQFDALLYLPKSAVVKQ